MAKIPILIVGDSPGLPSGLGRIARDIATGLWNTREALGIDLAQLGFDYRGEIFPWRISGTRDGETWGKRDLIPTWTRHFGNRRGVILTIWDAARCFELTEMAAQLPVQLWGYVAVDAESATGDLGTIGAATLRQYRRVLAYGRFGAKVIERALGRPVENLPHGIHTAIFRALPKNDKGEEIPLPRLLVGAVAANIQRKDFPLLFETWARMKDRRDDLNFWLHTNSAVGPAWSVPELVQQFGLTRNITVTGTEGEWPDEKLATLYQQCLVTIAPGPEGYGYPIPESLAAGAPVIGIDYAGGAELIPRAEWRVAPAAWRYDSVHVLKRPVMSAQAVANAALAAATIDDAGREVCRGSVSHLDWAQLWPKWQGLFANWLEELR